MAKELQQIKDGTMFVVIEGEVSCDFCGKEIKGGITRFENVGDFCNECRLKLTTSTTTK